MIQERKDAWTDEEDAYLTETVLQYIRIGSTQLKAFEDVGEKLGRTPAACGFRWNSEVRKNNEDKIVIAKSERMKVKKDRFKVVTMASVSNVRESGISIDLKEIKEVLERLMEVLEQYKIENEVLKEKINNTPELTLDADYKDIVRILQTARNMYDNKTS